MTRDLFLRAVGSRISVSSNNGGKERGRAWPTMDDNAIEPHPLAAQMMSTKWLIRRERPVCRYANKPSPVPVEPDGVRRGPKEIDPDAA